MVSITPSNIRWMTCILTYLSLQACSIVPSPTPSPVLERQSHRHDQTPTHTHSHITPQPINESDLSSPDSSQQSRKTRLKKVHPAIAKLLKQALGQQQQGDLEKSAATIERALRIRPNEPLAWNRLAFVRFQQEQWQQAEHLALKSNSLAANKHRLKVRNWRIIADARKHQGNAIGARAAQRQIRQLTR